MYTTFASSEQVVSLYSQGSKAAPKHPAVREDDIWSDNTITLWQGLNFYVNYWRNHATVTTSKHLVLITHLVCIRHSISASFLNKPFLLRGKFHIFSKLKPHAHLRISLSWQNFQHAMSHLKASEILLAITIIIPILPAAYVCCQQLFIGIVFC